MQKGRKLSWKKNDMAWRVEKVREQSHRSMSLMALAHEPCPQRWGHWCKIWTASSPQEPRVDNTDTKWHRDQELSKYELISFKMYLFRGSRRFVSLRRNASQ